jgi:hypothetical protein
MISKSLTTGAKSEPALRRLFALRSLPLDIAKPRLQPSHEELLGRLGHRPHREPSSLDLELLRRPRLP